MRRTQRNMAHVAVRSRKPRMRGCSRCKEAWRGAAWLDDAREAVSAAPNPGVRMSPRKVKRIVKRILSIAVIFLRTREIFCGGE